MIVSYIQGGLGNQMFCYAMGRDLLVWNALKVYGNVRLNLLLNSYNVKTIYGNNLETWKDYLPENLVNSKKLLMNCLDEIPIKSCFRGYIQPVFLLEPKERI